MAISELAHFFINPDASLKDFIQIYDDCVDYSLCDLIIAEYAPDDPSWITSTIMTDTGGSAANPRYRNSRETCLSLQSVIDENPLVRRDIDQRVFEICSKVWNDYVSRVTPYIKTKHDSGYQLLAYGVGAYFQEHTDALYYPEIREGDYVHIDHCAARQISISIQLNDNYEGGELTFFNGKYSVPKKKGLVTVFPSYSLFPHQVTAVTSGCRFSIVTWFS
jgi:hypothetical protein